MILILPHRGRKTTSAAFLVIGLLTLMAPAALAGAEITVRIDNFTFSPNPVSITPGTKVTWINHDDIPHALVETNQLFHSKALDTDDGFSYTFMTAGEFDYFCSLHPHMTGKVIVKP